MKNRKPTYEELEKRLTEAEKLVANLEKNKAAYVKNKRDAGRGKRNDSLDPTQELTDAYIASEQNFKNSMDASPLGIRIVTEDGELIYANKAILDICGYNTAQEMAAVPRNELYTPESYQAHLERRRKRKLKEYVPLEYEISIRRSDGKVRNLQVFRREINWGGEQQFMAMYQDITEHKRAEEALRQSEEKFHSIVEHGNDGIVFIQGGVVQYCNSKMLEISGYNQRDVLGKPFIDFIAPDNKKMVFDIYSKRMEGKKVRERYEVNLQGKDGRKINAEISASVVNFRQEQIDIAIVRDMTENKKAEEALRNSEERLRSIFSTAPVGIGMEINRIFVEVNENFCKMVGYTRDELIGQSSLMVYPNEEKFEAAGLEKQRQILSTGIGRTESHLRHKNGAILDVLIHTSPLDPNDVSRGFIFTVLDITERKKAEEALRESEEKFSKAFRSSPDAVTITTGDEGIIIDTNDTAVKNTGYSFEELIGHSVMELNLWVNLEDREKMHRLIETNGQVRHEIFQMRKKTGEIRIWDFSADLIMIGGKKCLISVQRDITESKKAEEDRASEAIRRRILIEQSRDGIVILDNDGKVYEVNQRFADMLGYSNEELSQLHVYDWEFLYPHERVVEMLRTVDEKGDHFETQHRRKDGTIYDVEISTNGAVFAGQKLVFCVCRDISERKRLEQAIRESEEMFSRAFHAGPAIIAITTIKDGKYVDINDSYIQSTGYTKEELIGQTSSSFNIWANEKDRARMFRILKKEGRINKEEFNFKMKSGEIRTWLFSAEPITIKGEECLIGVAIDISERKRAEEALKEISSRQEAILASVPDIIMEVDNNKVYTWANKAGFAFYGDDAIGKEADFYFEGGQDIYALVKPLFNGDESVIYVESWQRRKDGEKRLLAWWCRVLKDKDGNVTGALSTARDITETKKAEEALKESEARFRALFETMAQGVVYQEPDGKITSANPAAERILGVPLKKLRGRISTDPQWKSLHEDGTDFPGETHPSMVAVRSGKPVSNVVMGIYNPHVKEYRWILINAIPEFKKGEKTPYRVYTTFTDITESIKLREEIERDRSEIELIMDSSAALIWYKDMDGRFLRINKAFAEALNMPAEKFVGKTVFDLYSADIAQSMTDDDREVFVKGRSKLNIVEKYESATGLRWVQTDKVPVLDKNGQIIGLIGFAQDITAHKEAEEAIKESEEKFNKAFHASLNLMAIITLDKGKIIDVNEAYCKATGYKRKELIGNTALELNLWADPHQREEFYQVIAAKGRLENKEILLHTKAGELRTFLFSAEKVTLGGASCAVIAALDITERKRAEKRINYLNQTLRSIRNVNQLITREKDRDILLKSVCDTLVESHSFYTAWIVLLDESLKVKTHAASGISVDFTPVIEEFQKGNLPRCVLQALKKTLVITTPDPNTTCTGCPVLTYPLDFGGMTIRLEYAGIVYGVLCACLPKEILTDENEMSLFSEVASDIAFALYNMERESEYGQLEQERLRSAKLESIGTLAGGIAHDFNNLLTGIMGNIGLVKTYTSPSDDVYEMLDEAEKAAVRAKDLTQQLLTFARGGKPVKKLVDIAALINESAGFALRGSKARQELSLPKDLWPVEADEGQISQVINNLVINADEAMPLGGTLKISAENLNLKKADVTLLPGGNYVCIHISDTGIGMSAENLQRIFEPYFTTKQRGSGLGLTTAYSIVRNHGGMIKVDSKLNKGSNFHIYLPATIKASTKGGKKMKAVSSSQAGGKVLVMDDDEIIRKMLKNMLNLAGYIVELAAEGSEALEKYKQAQKEADPFNVVIMDLTIPGGMGGKEAVQKLLEIDPQAKVIVSSGYANDPIMSEFKKYGFKAVIAKPYSVKQLQESLSSLLTKKSK
ncbi:MAG: PAS domain S-box protein [Dehalococcoidales bacterium]